MCVRPFKNVSESVGAPLKKFLRKFPTVSHASAHTDIAHLSHSGGACCLSLSLGSSTAARFPGLRGHRRSAQTAHAKLDLSSNLESTSDIGHQTPSDTKRKQKAAIGVYERENCISTPLLAQFIKLFGMLKMRLILNAYIN